MHSFDFDLFVIGGGSAGVRAARTAAERGARVALAEAGELGGTCVNVGCIPKKLYSYAAGYAQAFKEAAGFGWRLDGVPHLDWVRLRAARAKEIHRLNAVYRDLLEGPGVTILRGRARLLDAHTVQVGDRRLRAEHLLVATGGRPFVPEIDGREHALVSDAMFDLDPFPRRLLVVGGGYIACEFASIFQGLGARVTLLHRGDHLLHNFDEDIRAHLAQGLREAGVDLRFGSEVGALQREASGLRATLKDGDVLEADAALFATGRVPNTEGLGLELAGVKLGQRGAIEVDALYRSSVPSILAVGDVSTRRALTPVALAEAAVVVDALFPPPGRPAREAPDYALVPTAVFTHPEVATCGLTEAQARERFGNVTVFRTEFRPLRHTLSGSAERCLMKLVADAASDRVVGLHMVGPDAAEIIQGFAVAMQAGATKAQFDRTIGIHPSTAEEFVTLRTPVTR